MPSVLLPNRVLGLSVRGGGVGFPWANLPGGNALHAWDFLNNTARWNSASVGALSNTPGWTFTRASTGYAQNAAGVLLPFASGELRRTDKGVLIEGARTNKCTNYNAVIPALVAMTTPAAFASAMTNIGASGPAGSLFGVVDDTSEIIAAGLASAVTSGRVIKVDNSAGATEAYLTFGGTTTNTNTHTYSLYLRGSGLVRYGDNAGFGGTFTMPTGFTRYSKTQAAGGASSVLGVGVAAGAVAYVILNQLEEASFVSSPIVVAGASATRAADALKITGLSIPAPYTLFVQGMPAVGVGTIASDIFTTQTSFADAAGLYRATGSFNAFVREASATTAIPTSGTPVANTRYRLAARFAVNDTQTCANGALGSVDAGNTPPTITQVNFGSAAYSFGGIGFEYIERAAIFSRGLVDAELQAVAPA